MTSAYPSSRSLTFYLAGSFKVQVLGKTSPLDSECLVVGLFELCLDSDAIDLFA